MYKPNSEIQDILIKVSYVIEANTFEIIKIVEEWRTTRNIIATQHTDKSWFFKLDEIIVNDKTMPVCISCCIYSIGDKYIMFYEPTSQIVDYRLIEIWLNNYTNCIRLDSMNSFNAL